MYVTNWKSSMSLLFSKQRFILCTVCFSTVNLVILPRLNSQSTSWRMRIFPPWTKFNKIRTIQNKCQKCRIGNYFWLDLIICAIRNKFNFSSINRSLWRFLLDVLNMKVCKPWLPWAKQCFVIKRYIYHWVYLRIS